MTDEPNHQSYKRPANEFLPAVNDWTALVGGESSSPLHDACRSWLMKSPSRDTRTNYARDLKQFLGFTNYGANAIDRLPEVRPHHVAAWRDALYADGLTNSSIRRKLTVLRSLFSYLQTYGYVGANPAHSDFVAAPAVPRDGKTVGLTPEECRRFLDGPSPATNVGVRNRAIVAVLAYTGCRVGELGRLRVGDYQQAGGHRVLNVRGKGGKERRVPRRRFPRCPKLFRRAVAASRNFNPLRNP
jgi:integrase/recombinase XerD